MSIPKTYQPSAIESKWYAYWLEKKFFHSVAPEPDAINKQEAYTIVMPPPNVTGILHMGHMLNNTIQDVLVRRARMLGKNACWVPGTDHASIATEAKVVALLKEKGLSKENLGREKFLEEAFLWKEKYGGIILEQLKKLGASCDWDRTRFTMEDSLSEAVTDVFVDLFNKGYIYRGIRMVNWDPMGRTAVSDEEVIRKTVNQKLYYINYPFTDGSGFLQVATTRPETIMADAAIAVNPADPRYTAIKGKTVRIPLLERVIPVIEDAYVSMDFGTGCLKVTPAHDLNDYEIGLRHKLPVLDILSEDGTLNEKAILYVGIDRFVARKQIAVELKNQGFLEKVQDYSSQIGFSERTDAVIEPRLSMQWFVEMKKMSGPALTAVVDGSISLIPAKFLNTYKHWIENVHDWCISRQLWWGQRIPAWYNEQGDWVVASNEKKALELFKSKGLGHANIRQDEDVVDTWFSSWLWPISVFDGFKDPSNKDISYYYPTDDLVTAPEILFFWVARMIMAGLEFRNEIPFKHVYLTGIIRDKQGRKMSKSLGNSPDPLVLIEQFGADAVRTGLLFSSPAGNDLIYDESLIEQGRNFANKIWNAFRLVKSWAEPKLAGDTENAVPGIFVERPLIQPDYCKVAVNGFNGLLQNLLEELPGLFDQYRLSEAIMAIYKLIWDDYCSWYLELIKPPFGEQIDGETLKQSILFFEEILKVLHPFMPFITEELWYELNEDRNSETIMFETWPLSTPLTKVQSNEATFLEQIIRPLITEIRNLRNTYSVSPKEILKVSIKKSALLFQPGWAELMGKIGNFSAIEIIEEKPASSTSILIKQEEFFVELGNVIDLNAELAKSEQELVYTRGFLVSVEKKLTNEKFMQNAKPAVIEFEQRKKADALIKIEQLETMIAEINNEQKTE